MIKAGSRKGAGFFRFDILELSTMETCIGREEAL